MEKTFNFICEVVLPTICCLGIFATTWVFFVFKFYFSGALFLALGLAGFVIVRKNFLQYSRKSRND